MSTLATGRHFDTAEVGSVTGETQSRLFQHSSRTEKHMLRTENKIYHISGMTRCLMT